GRHRERPSAPAARGGRAGRARGLRARGQFRSDRTQAAGRLWRYAGRDEGARLVRAREAIRFKGSAEAARVVGESVPLRRLDTPAAPPRAVGVFFYARPSPVTPREIPARVRRQFVRYEVEA